MALTYGQLDAVTDDYFLLDDGSATDNYFNTSSLLNYFLKQQSGLFTRFDSGIYIRVPIEYDEQTGAAYERGDTVDSTDRDIVNAARFNVKHYYSNATMLRIDELENTGPLGNVTLIIQKVANAQKTITKLLADSIYNLPTGSSSELTGLRALCNETTSLAYGNIQEADLASNDGTNVWEGKMDSTAQTLTLNRIRTLASDAKVRDGNQGRPDLVITTETLYNKVLDLLQVQQRFTEGKKTAEAGFTGVHFEGKDIFPDDYCPASHLFVLNSNYLGFAVHTKGMFMRTRWEKIQDSAEDKAMKIYWDGNMITNLRRAHKGHSSLS